MKVKNYQELIEKIKDKNIIVFGGYSGLEYEDKDGLKIQMEKDLQKYIIEYGKNNLAVISGATPEGIGAVYEIAKKLDLKTYGIVSTAALEYGENPQSIYCDITLFVAQPKNVWTVKNSEGFSLMVDVATKGKSGILHYYNGGQVAYEEIMEAKKRNINFIINDDFKPNKLNVTKKVKEFNLIGKIFISEPLSNI